MINKKMAQELVALGIKSDDTIVMHSSLSSLGYVEGGADTVIDTVLSVLNDGTLLVPALSFASVNADSPVFRVDSTPSCVGAISEAFRKREGVIRSMHPTHSICAIGKYAKELIAGHLDTDTPVGAKSPLALLPEYNGKILMLGCGLRPNTSMHGVEELAKPPYLFKPQKTLFTLIDKDGKETQKPYYCHNIAASGTIQRYDRLADIMNLEAKKVLEADCYLIDASEMWQKAHEALNKNEFYFVDCPKTVSCKTKVG